MAMQLGPTERAEPLGRGRTSDSFECGYVALGDGYRFHRCSGHTPGLLLTEVEMPGGPVVFAADLIPGKAWVHLPITMGYDRYPEMLIDEKAKLLGDLLARHGRLFFTHDPVVAMGTLARDDKGKFGITDELRDVRDLAS